MTRQSGLTSVEGGRKQHGPECSPTCYRTQPEFTDQPPVWSFPYTFIISYRGPLYIPSTTSTLISLILLVFLLPSAALR